MLTFQKKKWSYIFHFWKPIGHNSFKKSKWTHFRIPSNLQEIIKYLSICKIHCILLQVLSSCCQECEKCPLFSSKCPFCFFSFGQASEERGNKSVFNHDVTGVPRMVTDSRLKSPFQVNGAASTQETNKLHKVWLGKLTKLERGLNLPPPHLSKRSEGR